MSDARAVEAVTETLRSLVDVGVREVDAGASVVTRPLDTLGSTGQDSQVNLFLYQTRLEPTLRNEPPPGVRPGETGEPALPLVLHYLLTPYVRDGDDVVAHRLLGGALRILHEHPVLTGAELADIAPYSDVSGQLERIRITWQPLDEKDIFSLWSAFQTPYRLSSAFEVRVVLIDSRRPVRTPLPVLRRGPADDGPTARPDTVSPFPALTGASGPDGQPVARLRDEVVLHGVHLDAPSVGVRLSHPLRTEPPTVPVVAATDGEVRFRLPDDPDGLPAGIWTVALTRTEADRTEVFTNEVPLALAPRLTGPLPITVTPDGAGTALIELTCEPAVHPGQQVLLLLGARAVAAVPVVAPDPTVTVPVPGAEPGGYPLRLRVDGVESLLVDRSVNPPVFDPDQRVTVTR